MMSCSVISPDCWPGLNRDPATKFDGEKSSKNPAYVDAVARTNVGIAMEYVRGRSSVSADLEKKGSIQITGAMYDIGTGTAEFLV